MMWLGAIAVVAGVLCVLAVLGMLHNHASAIRELTEQLRRVNELQGDIINLGVARKIVAVEQLAIEQRVLDSLKALLAKISGGRLTH